MDGIDGPELLFSLGDRMALPEDVGTSLSGREGIEGEVAFSPRSLEETARLPLGDVSEVEIESSMEGLRR